MIARPRSQQVPELARVFLRESALAPDARRREVAALLARGALRALWRDVGHVVAKDVPPTVEAPSPRSRNGVALGRQPEPSSCRARPTGAARPPLADTTSECSHE